jgi:hypothetical protein
VRSGCFEEQERQLGLKVHRCLLEQVRVASVSVLSGVSRSVAVNRSVCHPDQTLTGDHETSNPIVGLIRKRYITINREAAETEESEDLFLECIDERPASPSSVASRC